MLWWGVTNAMKRVQTMQDECDELLRLLTPSTPAGVTQEGRKVLGEIHERLKECRVKLDEVYDRLVMLLSMMRG
ncbi:MAG: hypothetical protein QXI60_03025 [Thermofilaceae archaeon]